MIKRIFLILSLAFASMSSFAQSMTDDQVIKYVIQENEKGTSQSTIVTNLLKKGVTTSQLQRVRKKYEAEKGQLGATDLTGKTANVTESRLRQNKQKAGEQTQVQDNYMLPTTARTPQERAAVMTEELSMLDLGEGTGKATGSNQVFGRNIFNNQMLSFQPNMSIATPANYRLGAGDHVIIDVWGASQETFEGDISPDGTVTISGVGPVKLSGMSVSEANGQIKSRLGKYYEGSNIQLTVGSTRSIQVQVMGEVNVPGTYTLSSLSTAFNALYMAGGINDIGTLRNIIVYRQGRKIASIDVYDYILNGNSKGDVRLQDNDVIVVGPYDALVEIRGKVKRPMFYEMKSSETAKTILDYAGGFTGDAYKKNVRVTRKNGAEYSIHTVEEFEWSNFKLNDGDSIFIGSVIPRYSNMVEVRGAVFHPGMYQMDGKINSVRELVNACEGLREDAFTTRAVMHRENEDKTLKVIAVDILGIMNGSVADIPLQKNDVLFIPSKLDMKGDQTFKVSGEVNYPGVYVYADNTTLEDIILQAGGLTNAASTVKIDVYRRITNSSALADDNILTTTYSFALKDGFVIDGEQGFILEPFDEVVVRRSPTYSTQQNVSVSGCVNFSGVYSMSNRGYRLSDLIRDAGGVSALAYVKGARLERTMTQEEKEKVELSIRNSQIALYEESLHSDSKNFDLQRADTLLQMKMDVGNTYPVAVDLEEALRHPGSEEDIILRQGDNLNVPQYTSAVQISGDVMSPVSMNYKKGKKLGYYIKHAGGYGNKARKSRVYVIYMNGSVKKVNRFSTKDIQPGCQIVVPSKEKKQRMSTAEILSIGSSSASIAAVAATIANILK